MRKILIVEDDKNIALLIADTLSISNYDCVNVYDGIKALELILENEYDLIILDIMLPGLNGFELQQKIKKAPNFLNQVKCFNINMVSTCV